jgi:hypothetical protein
MSHLTDSPGWRHPSSNQTLLFHPAFTWARQAASAGQIAEVGFFMFELIWTVENRDRTKQLLGQNR